MDRTEERIRSGLRAGAPSADPAGVVEAVAERLRRRERRGALRRRVGAGVVAVMVAIPGAVLAIRAFGSHGSVTGGDGDGLATYVDPTFGWTISYPEQMHLRLMGGPEALHRGGSVSNFHVTTGGFSTGELAEFPPGGVLLRVWSVNEALTFGGLHWVSRDDETRLPISLDSFPRSRAYTTFLDETPLPGSREPDPLYRDIEANGESFSIAVWFGPDASREDRAAIADVVESLRFPPLGEGTMAGQHFYVLQPADEYEIGSPVFVGIDQLPTPPGWKAPPGPLWVVRAPDGFYGVTAEQNEAPCPRPEDHTWDPERQEFYCAGTDPPRRWDRAGRSLTGVPPLQLLVAKVAQDGHLLVSPFAFRSAADIDGLWRSEGSTAP
jgi:hypothetical protein